MQLHPINHKTPRSSNTTKTAESFQEIFFFTMGASSQQQSWLLTVLRLAAQMSSLRSEPTNTPSTDHPAADIYSRDHMFLVRLKQHVDKL